jgi:hypothetical protein
MSTDKKPERDWAAMQAKSAESRRRNRNAKAAEAAEAAQPADLADIDLHELGTRRLIKIATSGTNEGAAVRAATELIDRADRDRVEAEFESLNERVLLFRTLDDRTRMAALEILARGSEEPPYTLHLMPNAGLIWDGKNVLHPDGQIAFGEVPA